GVVHRCCHRVCDTGLESIASRSHPGAANGVISVEMATWVPAARIFPALASVTCLVQYCINTCSAVDAAQTTIPLLPAHARQSAATRFLKKRPARRETSIRWPDRFQGNDRIRTANGPASSN